ncbi:MAG: hypothetical protein WC254_03500 [Candidatus Woesearchaeota archaeon]|jgi:hypothetical protein
MKKIILLFVLLLLCFIASCTHTGNYTQINNTTSTPPITTTPSSVIITETKESDIESEYGDSVLKVESFSGTLSSKETFMSDSSGSAYDTSVDYTHETTYTISGDKVYFNWKQGYTLYLKNIEGLVSYEYSRYEIDPETGKVVWTEIINPTSASFSETVSIPSVIGEVNENNEYEFRILPGYYTDHAWIALSKEIDSGDGTETKQTSTEFMAIAVGGGDEEENCPDVNDQVISSAGLCIYRTDSTELTGTFNDYIYNEEEDHRAVTTRIETWTIS